MAPSPTPPSSPLFDQLEALYPLACVLAGTDAADALLLRVAERATDTSPEERPDDVQSWLLGLLLQDYRRTRNATSEAERTEGEPRDDLRKDVTRQRVKEAVPAALAACSIEERFLLALDVSSVSDTLKSGNLATTLDLPRAEAHALQNDAWATFNQHLDDTLSATDRSLVHQTLPDDAIRTAVHETFASRLPSMPSSVRARVRSVLENGPAESEEGRSELSAEPTGQDTSSTSWSGARTVLVSLTVLAVVAASAIGVAYWSRSPSLPPSTAPLSAFSAQHLQAVELALSTDRPERAKAYVASTWNRDITVPAVSGSDLRGIGHLRLPDGPDIPVFLYGDPADTGRIAIFAYSYALVDELEPQATLGRTQRQALAENRHLVTRQDSANARIIWRDQDDIFVAVAPSLSPEELSGRIRP